MTKENETEKATEETVETAKAPVAAPKQTEEAIAKEESEEDEEETAEVVEERGDRRPRRRGPPTREELLEGWVPKTKVGRLVRDKEIRDLDEILGRYKILEPEIADTLLNLKNDLLLIGQAKGKFGGGKRTWRKQTQKKTAEGNVPTFSVICVVGDNNGHVGIGRGRAKETVPAKEKALRKAKLSIIKIVRGCGSFDCSCNEPHSIQTKVSGKEGSVRVDLMPAPQGTGLVVSDELKKILSLSGIKDVYGRTFGKTRTTTNLAKACMEALNKTTKIKTR